MNDHLPQATVPNTFGGLPTNEELQRIAVETSRRVQDMHHNTTPWQKPTTPWKFVKPADAGGVKHDSGKPSMSLLDRHALEAVARVLDFGAKKYSPHNWREGFDYSRLTDAALRHVFAFIDGEDTDAESGESHIAHAMCCLMFLEGLRHSGRGKDDRHTAT